MENELNKEAATQEIEGLIDKAELARRASITTRTVDSWMKDGILPYYKLNRQVRFKWSDVLAHITGNYRVVSRPNTGSSIIGLARRERVIRKIERQQP